ncbi:30S ribosomal protein S13 [Pseudomonadota bacterium]
MPRISGVDIPENKRIDISLTRIYGIGRQNVTQILKDANIDPSTKADKLSRDQIATLQRVIEKINTEGNLRKLIRDNVERLKRISTYRGLRHTLNLPVRGQRTRTNARTKRGKRMTIGALTKEMAQKQTDQSAK